MEINKPVKINENVINVDINHPVLGWITFSASKDDCESYGVDIYNRAKLGEFGEVLNSE